MKKLSIIILLVVLVTIGLSGCKETASSNASEKIKLKGTTIETDSEKVKIEGETATITKGGTYEITGTLDDGQVKVQVSDSEKVVIILNGVEIHNEESSPIYVANAKETTITLAKDSTNKLSDGKKYIYGESETEPDATIFSHDDLIINGSGSLKVNGNYQDAIASKDDLNIEGGTLTIVAADDGIRGKDSVTIKKANIQIESKAVGIKATNEEEAEKGFIAIESGTFNINSVGDSINGTNVTINGGTFEMKTEDDGIHGNEKLEINNGEIYIEESYEGIEASEIVINGGKINIMATDDAVNGAGGSDTGNTSNGPQDMFSSSTGTLTITGGKLIANAEGDGIDINGDTTMSGGTVIVYGPTDNGNGALDYDGSFNITGGKLIAGGSSGMAMAPSTDSKQLSILVNFESMNKSGTEARLVSADGNELLKIEMKKDYQSVLFSSKDIKDNTSYDIYVGDTKYATITTNGKVTTYGSSGGGMQQGGPMGR